MKPPTRVKFYLLRATLSVRTKDRGTEFLTMGNPICHALEQITVLWGPLSGEKCFSKYRAPCKHIEQVAKQCPE
jgi:hypothetical protein